jgi:2-methylcitrate dehydratase
MRKEDVIKQLSAFITGASYEDMSAEARLQIKVRVLDWLACALGAVGFKPMRRLRNHIEECGGEPLVTMIGGRKTSPDRAALYNSALTRYLGFNDSFLCGEASCHPSDSISAVLAASEYRGASGRDLLTALAVSYQVQCRLCEVSSLADSAVSQSAPGPYAVAAGIAKALKLNREQTASAIASIVAASKALQAPRVDEISRRKNILYSDSPFAMAQAVLLSLSSISDDHEASEAETHLLETLAPNLEIDWGKEDLEAVRRTIIKRFNAEINSQSAIEAILHLRERRPCHPNQIDRIELDTFEAACYRLGAGGGGTGYQVRTRTQAYHSLPYLLAVALLDGEVSPAQYKPDRILREDVQSLMRKVVVRPDRDFSKSFPQEMPARVQIFLRDGQILTKEKRDYEGFFTRPMTWERAVEKFRDLTVFQTGYESGERIIEKVLDIEDIQVRELCELLAGMGRSAQGRVQEKVLTLRKHRLAA